MIKRAFIALTGASGTIYGLSAIHILRDLGVEVFACATKNALKNAETELGAKFANAKELFTHCGINDITVFEEDETGAGPASGSFQIDCYIIAPASMGFVGRAAAGISSNLPERAADVALKEKKPLVVLFREMPLSVIHLENLLRLARAGAYIMPASPAFYHKPETIDELINFTIGKVLDIIGIENNLFKRWK